MAVRQQVIEVIVFSQPLSAAQFDAELRARTRHIEAEAARLRTATRQAFGHTAVGVLMAITGAAWTAFQGDLVGAVLAVGGVGATTTLPKRPVTAYSYLFGVRAVAD